MRYLPNFGGCGGRLCGEGENGGSGRVVEVGNGGSGRVVEAGNGGSVVLGFGTGAFEGRKWGLVKNIFRGDVRIRWAALSLPGNKFIKYGN